MRDPSTSREAKAVCLAAAGAALRGEVDIKNINSARGMIALALRVADFEFKHGAKTGKGVQVAKTINLLS